MKILLFEQFNNKKIIGYHITREKLLPQILKKGLEPRVPQDYGDRGDMKGVYLFKTVDDFDNALTNWFGERIEEWEEEKNKEFDESLIVVDLTGLELYDSVEFEWTCLEHIHPDRFLEVFKYDDFGTDIYEHLKSTYENQ